MTMVKVHINMDEGWSWSIGQRLGCTETIEIDEELVREYNMLSRHWYDLQGRLEQLYRVQEGLKPWTQPEIPEHVRLTGG